MENLQGQMAFQVNCSKNIADQISPILLSVFEDSLTTGSLPLTMQQAVISLIPEKDKKSD